MKVLGTTDRDFAGGLLKQLLLASRRNDGGFDADRMSFPLAVIREAKPENPLAAMHVVQMALVHMATTKISGQLARAIYLTDQVCAVRELNQLARTYTGQLEALKRVQGGAASEVTVAKYLGH